MPWDKQDLTAEQIAAMKTGQPIKNPDAIGHPSPAGDIPPVTRVHVKVEDVFRSDLRGCLNHPTAGAIQQFTSWVDPITGKSEGRWTGYIICAECSVYIGGIDPNAY